MCETVTRDIEVVVYRPVDDGGELGGFEEIGVISEIQKDSTDFDPDYPSTQAVAKWVEHGEFICEA